MKRSVILGLLLLNLSGGCGNCGGNAGGERKGATAVQETFSGAGFEMLGSQSQVLAGKLVEHYYASHSVDDFERAARSLGVSRMTERQAVGYWMEVGFFLSGTDLMIVRYNGKTLTLQRDLG